MFPCLKNTSLIQAHYLLQLDYQLTGMKFNTGRLLFQTFKCVFVHRCC